MAAVGKKAELLELGIQRGGNGIFEAAQPAVKGIKGVLAQHPVTGHQQRHKGAVRQGMLVALAVRHIGVGHIRIPQRAADPVGRVRHLPGSSQQLFFRRRQNMGLTAANTVQAAPICQQLRLCRIEKLQGILVNGQNFRRGKRRSAGNGHIHTHRLAAQILIVAVGGILIALAIGIAHQAAQTHLQLVLQAEKGQQILRAAAQRALERRDLLRIGAQRLIFRQPCRVACKNVL